MEDQLIIYNSVDGKSKVTLLARDEMIWLNQLQMAELFATSKQNISVHISNILSDKELNKDSVVKDYLTTAADGKPYNIRFYALPMILAVGFRVRNARGVQFRQWANMNLSEFLQKGFILDDERLKNPDGRPDYFDELLKRIADIRASEKRFYQKLRDLFALSSDYDKTDKATQMFFAATQNKLLFAVTGHTAAEIIMNRADASALNMGLTSWKGNIVRKGDVIIAKNYLNEEELKDLNQLVVIFLESAEFQARRRKDITMNFWKTNVDSIIASHGLELLNSTGSCNSAQAEIFAGKVYEEFNKRRKILEKRDADNEDLRILESIEAKLKQRNTFPKKDN